MSVLVAIRGAAQNLPFAAAFLPPLLAIIAQGKKKENRVKTLNRLSLLGRALQWFTLLWVVQLLIWSLCVSLFNAAGADAPSFTTFFMMLLQKYGWMPFVIGLGLRALCYPWMPTPTGRGAEPQPGGTY